MSTTTSKVSTFQRLLAKMDLNILADLFRKMKFGRTLGPVKVTVSGLTASAAPDITSAAVKAAGTIVGMDLETGENLPPIGRVISLRVVASGTAASLGTYGVTDTGGTAIIPPGGASAAMGIAKLSDDGTTLTFPNTVTGFVLVYYPRIAVAMTDDSDFYSA
jgi:hypothetical protein